MNYKGLALALLVCGVSLHGADGEAQSKDKFFWDDDSDVDADIVRHILALVNKALTYKVESEYFYYALMDICRIVDSLSIEAREKKELQDKLASLVKLIAKKGRRENREMAKLRREIKEL